MFTKQITLVSKFKLWAELLKFDGQKFKPTGDSSAPNTWHDDGDGTVTVTVEENFMGAIVLHHQELGPSVQFINLGEEELAAFPVPEGALINENPYKAQFKFPASGREWMRAVALDAAGYVRTAWSTISAQTANGVVWLPLKEGGFAVELPHHCEHTTGAAFLIESSSGTHQIVNGYSENAPVYKDGVILRSREWREEDQHVLEPVIRFLSKGGKTSTLYNAAKKRWPEALVNWAFAQTHPCLHAAWCK